MYHVLLYINVVLLQVHYEMAVYHGMGRFTPEPDTDAAMFHLKKAGDCDVLKALYLLGCVHLQLPHATLEILKVQVGTCI